MPLLIDLLRHGKALSSDPGGDSQRALAPEGDLAIRRLSERLAGRTERPGRIFTSPLRRARETARIVARGLGLSIPIEELSALEPEHDPQTLVEALELHGATEGHVLVVGHQPQLGRLAAHLTGTETSLAPGDLLRIDCPERLGRNSCKIVLELRHS